MAKFFENGSDTRDMYAKDFLQTPIIAKPTTGDLWRDHVDKHLAHLTIARVTNDATTKVVWTGAQNKDFLREFRAMWQEFYKNLEPSLKPTFDAEIAAMQKQFPKVPLT
jgi:capsid protein